MPMFDNHRYFSLSALMCETCMKKPTETAQVIVLPRRLEKINFLPIAQLMISQSLFPFWLAYINHRPIHQFLPLP